MVETGGMKLIELHIGDAATCSPGHRDTVAGGSVWIAGVEVDLACSAGREHNTGAGNGRD